MNFPKVSIITVCYNSEKTVEQTIKSVLNQTYHNIEYIIVDGGSTDNTLAIIQKYKEYLFVISEPDDGLYHAMNKGIMRATGDIVGIINSDDWYEEGAAKLAVEYIENKGCDLVYGRCTYVSENDVRELNYCNKLEELKYRMVLYHCTVFVKKIIYEKYGIFNQHYKIAADYDLMLRFYKVGVKMREIPQNIAYFRLSGISRNNYINMTKEAKKIALSHWNGDSEEERKKIEEYSDCRVRHAKDLAIMKELNGNIINPIISKVFPGDNGYAIFGVGEWGVQSMQFFVQNGCKVDYFIDNNSEKWDSLLMKIEVKNPDILQREKKNVIIANVYHEREIQEQLEDMGYRSGKNCIDMGSLLEKLLDEINETKK